MVLILTGQPGSGKTMLASELKAAGVVGHVIDGDTLRSWDNPGYSPAGRRENVGRAHAIARYLHEQGEAVAVALVQPYADQRLSLRDATGGIIVHLTGVWSKREYLCRDYEEPLAPDVVVSGGDDWVEAVKRASDIAEVVA